MARHDDNNAASRSELDAAAARVRDGSVTRSDGEWSASTVLAHIAFWDRMVLRRWRGTERYRRRYPDPLPDGIEDLVNDAAAPAWGLLSPAQAAAEAIAAAEAVDAYVTRIPADVVAELGLTGKERLVDRSLHRREHLATLDRSG